MSVNGLVVMTPTSIASTGTGNSSSIGANGKVTFSSCATLSLNGVFTSSYDNYMMVVRNTSTAVNNMVVRLRVAGTDATGSNYTRQLIYANSTSVTGGRATETSAIINAPYNTQRIGTTLYLFGPYLAQPTAMRSVTAMDVSSAGIYDIASTHSLSTSYDGITIQPQSGTDLLTGEVTVYGFNQ